ncbi:T-cell receptor beta chain V region CTL-L17 [Tupaia chinensis]|nr:T-cell receptor beta chain V region CTL-L17 [Tupaia chinensis]
MVTKLLCWVVLCLLETGHTDVGVSQYPRYRVTVRGQNVTLKCDPISGHTRLYWYQQTVKQGLEFLLYFQGTDIPDKSGLPSDRFSPERPKGSSSALKIQPAEPEDSAMYLCASSLTTVGHCPLLPAHKAPVLSFPHSSQKLSPRSCPNLPTSKGRNAFGTPGAPLTGGQEIAFEIPDQLTLGSNNFTYGFLGFFILSLRFYSCVCVCVCGGGTSS